MNKKQFKQINKNLLDSRKQIKFQNTSLQRNMVEQLELTTCKMFEYIKDQSSFLKSYINELREIKPEDLSLSLLDGLEETIRTIKQEIGPSRRAYEAGKLMFKDDYMEELDGLMFHAIELNTFIISLDRIEKILFSYPPSKN